MVVNKVLQGHGDPLLLEVVLGLEKEIHHELETKDGDAASKGTRGLGERHLGIGDPLFKESERYHHAENDHVAGVAANVALHERLLKHNKHSSLFVQHVGSAYDPILQEYVMPKATLEELKALEDDIVHKRALFHELSVRKRYNLDEQELYCDPLVSKYRIQELMFRRSFLPLKPKTDFVEQSKYRKLVQGDPLLTATESYHAEKPVPVVACTYRKLNAGDPMIDAATEYHK
jgi:hypothetical protein